MQNVKIWPLSKDHYLICDEARWLPYVSNALMIIQWAYNEGLIDEDYTEHIIKRNPEYDLPRGLRETDRRTVLAVLAKMGRSTLKDVATFMESDMASIGKALGDLVKNGLANRTQIAAMVDGKPRKRWLYYTEKTEHEAFSCAEKRAYQTQEEAIMRANTTKSRNPLESYQCAFCSLYHIGRKR